MWPRASRSSLLCSARRNKETHLRDLQALLSPITQARRFLGNVHHPRLHGCTFGQFLPSSLKSRGNRTILVQGNPPAWMNGGKNVLQGKSMFKSCADTRQSGEHQGAGPGFTMQLKIQGRGQTLFKESQNIL